MIDKGLGTQCKVTSYKLVYCPKAERLTINPNTNISITKVSKPGIVLYYAKWDIAKMHSSQKCLDVNPSSFSCKV